MTTVLRRRRHQLMLTLLATLAGLAAVVITEPPKAAAHSDLTASSPTAGSRGAAPAFVVLTFSEKVEPAFTRVTLTVDRAEPVTLSTQVTQVTQSQVRATPPAETVGTDAQQEWKVAYRVVSGDGHPITGSIKFTITPGSGSGSASASASAMASASAAAATPNNPTEAPIPPTPKVPPASAGGATPSSPTSSPSSTVRPGFPPETDSHPAQGWIFIAIMSAMLLLVPILAALFSFLPVREPGTAPDSGASPEEEAAATPTETASSEAPPGDGKTDGDGDGYGEGASASPAAGSKGGDGEVLEPPTDAASGPQPRPMP